MTNDIEPGQGVLPLGRGRLQLVSFGLECVIYLTRPLGRCNCAARDSCGCNGCPTNALGGYSVAIVASNYAKSWCMLAPWSSVEEATLLDLWLLMRMGVISRDGVVIMSVFLVGPHGNGSTQPAVCRQRG